MTKHEDALDFDLNKLPSGSETNVEGQRGAERGKHANFNGASSSRHIDIDLNEPLPITVAERGGDEQPNGASSLNIRIDLNMPPSEYETPWLSLSLRTLTYHHSIPETTPNPNPQSSPSREKRPLVRKRRKSGGGNKRAKKPRREAALEEPTPAWLVQVMESMEEAEDARLILKKTLFESDVKRAQSRFLITFKQLERNDFLTQEESRFLEQDKVEKGKGIKVVVVNQRSEKWNLRFKKWEMRNNKTSENGSLNYALNRGWNAIVEGNALKAGDKIDLWSFRSQGSLCFALGKK